MKTKLIKLSDTHYIVVDDSEIKEGDWYWTPIKRSIEQCVKKLLIIKGSFNDIKQFKITNSTQPLEPSIYSTRHDNKGYLFIKPLTLSEVEEAIYGYSVKKMAINSFGHRPDKYDNDILFSLGKGYVGGYQQGFKAHQELVKDKLFTLEQINQAINLAYVSGGTGDTYQDCQKFIEEQLELLPKTEWDIEFDEQDRLKLV